jgi:hypothetical protein
MSLFGGIFHALFGGGGPKKDPYAALNAQLNPLIKAETDVTTKTTQAGLDNIGTARNDLDYVSNWLKKIVGGSDDEILKMLDASGITANMNENAQQVAEQGIRGGARAAIIGSSSANKDAALQRALQQLRFAAPDKIAAIANSIGNLGAAELGTGTNASNAASGDIFGVQNFIQQDKARKTELLGSIFESIGTAAGLIACVTLDTPILTPTGYKNIEDLKVGDIVMSFSLDTFEPCEREIIRERIVEGQEVISIAQSSNFLAPLRATPSHEFYADEKFGYTLTLAQLNNNTELLQIISETDLTLVEKPIKFVNEAIKPVKWIKLDDEENNYPVITGIYISVDDDCLREN